MERRCLVVAYYGTERWWRSVLKDDRDVSYIVTTEQRTGSDYPVAQWYNESITSIMADAAAAWTSEEITDIIIRCRVLRWLPPNTARRMIAAMTLAYERLYSIVKPDYILSLPIDRYSKDIAMRVAERLGIPTYELTVSPLPGRCMLMRRGKLIRLSQKISDEDVKYYNNIITDEYYKPYYTRKARIGAATWIASYSYQLFRAWAFFIKSMVERDPLNVHYLDSRRSLGHKVNLSDIRLLKRIASAATIDEIAQQGNFIFIPLQLYPEASLDYWIEDYRLHDQELVLSEVVDAAKRKGLSVIIKDHPLQLGFRLSSHLDAVLDEGDVYLAPYNYNSNLLARRANALFTLTGTLGWQSAICGGNVICCRNYYSHPDHMVTFNSHAQMQHALTQSLVTRDSFREKSDRSDLIRMQLANSFEGEFSSLSRYPSKAKAREMLALGERIKTTVKGLEC